MSRRAPSRLPSSWPGFGGAWAVPHTRSPPLPGDPAPRPGVNHKPRNRPAPGQITSPSPPRPGNFNPTPRSWSLSLRTADPSLPLSHSPARDACRGCSPPSAQLCRHSPFHGAPSRPGQYPSILSRKSTPFDHHPPHPLSSSPALESTGGRAVDEKQPYSEGGQTRRASRTRQRPISTSSTRHPRFLVLFVEKD
jgi:hypothetical protein